MRLLLGCECSGEIRRAFRARGHDAWSCDLKPAEDGSEYHIVGDVLEVVRRERWDGLIAHPECTYLCNSGIHWNARRPERQLKTEEAVDFFIRLWSSPIPNKCLENSAGIMSTRFRRPDQIIQPYQFGEDASKATHLWLQGFPRLRPTSYFPPRIVNGRPRWANQTDSGQNKLPPSESRSADRARTYPGIAAAMADQWGGVLPKMTRQLSLI